MTDLIKTYDSAKPPKSLIGTKRMYRWLEQMLERRDAFIADARVYNSMTKTIATLMRSIRDTEIFNYRIKTKWEMLRDPDWRARVLRELGGEKALTRWEVRKAKADAAVWTPKDKRAPRDVIKSDPLDRFRPDHPRPDCPRKASRFKTDSQGQFRLARISVERPSWVTPDRRDRSGEYRGPREITFPDLGNIKFPVIPLEPFELRGYRDMPSPHLWGEVPEAIAQGDGGKLSSVDGDPLDRRESPPSLPLGVLPPINGEKGGLPRPPTNKRATTKHLALGTTSDVVLDTANPPPGATLKVKWSGFGPRPAGLGPD